MACLVSSLFLWHFRLEFRLGFGLYFVFLINKVMLAFQACTVHARVCLRSHSHDRVVFQDVTWLSSKGPKTAFLYSQRGSVNAGVMTQGNDIHDESLHTSIKSNLMPLVTYYARLYVWKKDGFIWSQPLSLYVIVQDNLPMVVDILAVK